MVWRYTGGGRSRGISCLADFSTDIFISSFLAEAVKSMLWLNFFVGVLDVGVKEEVEEAEMVLVEAVRLTVGLTLMGTLEVEDGVKAVEEILAGATIGISEVLKEGGEQLAGTTTDFLGFDSSSKKSFSNSRGGLSEDEMEPLDFFMSRQAVHWASLR